MNRFYIFLFIVTPLFAQSVLPNSTLTPGDTASNVMLMELCNPEYRPKIFIDKETKAKVFKRYRISAQSRSGYYLDLLIPITLAGSASYKNVWPQPKLGKWGHDSHTKKTLEKLLNWRVCNALMTRQDAQKLISENWIEAYQYYVLGDSVYVPKERPPFFIIKRVAPQDSSQKK